MRAVFTAILFLISLTLPAQMFDPVSWDFTLKKVSGNEYELVFTGDIDEGWGVYSQYLERDDGPIATTITWEEGDHYTRIGKAEEAEENREEGYDAIFEMNLAKYHDRMVITQRLRISDTATPVKGSIMFMTCDDERCLPPKEVPFEVVADGESPGDQPGASPGEGMESVSDEELYGIGPDELVQKETNCGVEDSSEDRSSLWNIFLLGLLGGFIAILTPCVFPMIPLTVSFFTKGSEKQGKGISRAVLYGFFIALVYVILSVPFHLAENVNPDILNEISTNVWLNLAFFVIFLVFAFSFFGYFELTLPSSWANRISSAEGIGGVAGIFFMALTLALVSFSCTGPILGSLLAGALTSTGGAWQLTMGMTGFGVALALPFALFAVFPNWMASLPKSGSWMNTIKVTLGFIELALALKFLSNADLVQHWGLLKLEVFLSLWILIFLGLGLYLFGKLRFPHEGDNLNISWFRKGLGVVSIAFAAYLATGFDYNEKRGTYEPLKLLSGLAPPAGYSWAHPSQCPNNIDCFNDLQTGLAFARENNKPIMLDFTGYACVNCRKMEEHVWPEKDILKLLKEDYVLISLYVDDKKALPESQQVKVKRVNGGTRKLVNYGHKWAHFQTKYFAANSQPFYVLLAPDGRTVLNKPVTYTPEPEEYQDFLECGLKSFREMNPFGGSVIGTSNQ